MYCHDAGGLFMSDSNGKVNYGAIMLFVVVVIVGAGFLLTQFDATRSMMNWLPDTVKSAVGMQATAEPADSSSPLPSRSHSVTAPPDSITPPSPDQGAAQPGAKTPDGQPAPVTPAASGGLFGQPPAGTSSSASQPDSSPLSLGKLLTNPFGGGAKGSVAAGPENGPVRILQKCMDKLHTRDIIGAEYFVSENGKKLTLNSTIGIHKILLKFVIDSQTYDEIGYGDANIAGQTTWVPIYSSLDPNGKQKRMVTAYIIMANRGDGWKIDDLYDAR